MSAGRQGEIRRVADHDKAIWREEMERRVAHYQQFRGNGPEVEKARLAEAEKARDYNYWLSTYGWMAAPKADDPDLRIIPFIPWPSQIELGDWYDERMSLHESGLVPKSREIGVTWWFLHRFFHSFLFERGFSALLGSRKADLVDKKGDLDSLFERLRFVLRRQPDWIVGPRDLDGKVVGPDRWIRSNHMLMENLTNGSSLVGEHTNPEFGAGKRRTVVLIDEAARVRADIMAATWQALESVAKAKFLVYNTKSKGHLTWQLHKGKNAVPPERVFEMKWTADPRRDESFKENRILPKGDLTPEQFEQEYECKYGTVDKAGLIFAAPAHLVAYDERSDDPNSRRRRQLVLDRCMLYGGWDFGSGPSLLCCLLALYEPPWKDPDTGEEGGDIVWIEKERAWQQTEWRIAAEDVLSDMQPYPWRETHFGDPAGIQRDSEQRSWQTNLQNGGIPLFCLPGEYNTGESIEWGFKLVQARLDEGKLKIRRSCSYLWECIDEWSRNVPDGLHIDFFSKEYIAPRADRYSHGGMALTYLIMGIDLAIARTTRPNLAKVMRSASAIQRSKDGGYEPMHAAKRLGGITRGLEVQRKLRVNAARQGLPSLPEGHPERRSGLAARNRLGNMYRKANYRKGR